MIWLTNYWQSRIVVHRKIINYLFLLGLVAYGQRAFNNYLYADDFWRSHIDYFLSGLPTGRFMMTALWLVTGVDFAPAFGTFLFLLIGITSAVVIAKLVGAKDDFNLFIFSALMIINPIICRHLQFIPHHLPLALGFFFLAIVCEILHNSMHANLSDQNYPKFFMLLYCSFIHALMIGIRQDFITLSSVLFVAIFLKLLHEFPNARFKLLLTNLSTSMMMFLLSILLYYVFNKLLISLTGQKELSGNYATFSSLVRNKSELMQAILRVKGSMYDYFIYKNNRIVWVVKLLVAINSAMMILSIFASARYKFRWNIFGSILLGVVATGLIFILPWQIAFFRDQHNSVLMTALLGVVAMWATVFSYVSTNGYFLIMRRLAKVAGVITLVCFLFSASRSCHEIQNKYNQLNLLAVDLLRDIKQVMNEKNYSATSSVTVVIANSQRVLSIEEGYVFLEWVVGAVNNDPRLDILGDDYTTHLTTEQRERVRNLDLSMPEWPAKDYIKVDRDLIVVKMNPKTLGKF